MIDDDTIINLANEVHRAMPPGADDQQEVLAIVREVLKHPGVCVPEKDMHADMEIPMHDTVFNAVHRVYFRAGLLAMRELLARAITPRNPVLANGLRTVWVPDLSEDPGAPRQLHWGEIANGGEEGPWTARDDIDPSVEALPIALQFIEAEDCKPAGHIPVDDIRDVAALVDVVLSMDLASGRGKVAKALARKLAGIEQADPGGGPDDIVRCYQHLLDLLGATTHEDAAREIGRLHAVLLSKPMILKGIGKINGDGFKDTTKVGQVVYVWNAELAEPYAPGQFPRVGNDGWSASRDQFDFEPATIDEVRALFAEWGKPSGVLSMESAR